MLAENGSRRYRKTTSSSRGLYVFTPRRTSLFRTSRRRAKRALLPLSKQSEIGIGWRQQANALTELGIVCSLSSGRIVANPEITRFFPMSGLPVNRPERRTSQTFRSVRNSPGFQRGRIIASMPVNGESANGPPMRSPDGRLIRCPKCLFQPPADHRWICKCDHVWNRFETSGHCPSCHVNWAVVVCPRCGELPDRQRWYADEV